ncbi:hypothetical protein BKA67DRAFT_657304 [Truncatella angustata]|uniref:Uncharacterized protein n=1 Tax=Truncatella angustata TaxID=152316 RepID=A0A9P8ZYN2_9PEZI|nr:uncharacterized protein BKA67DRAFT_657304 [Truncatella angustata]KAH6655357.1 hypothetical protein BKA67DRAFT_657304 [Truncatella angustata]
MGSTLSAVKTLIVPAVISLILFIVCSYILVPLWRQYRQRYSQYLPLETISNQTSSFRVRAQHAIAKWLIPARWRQSLHGRLVTAEGSDAGFDSDDGEELGDVDDDRRHALSLDTSGRIEHTDTNRRLSRDLEEGFMDDSDEEGDNRDRNR